MPKLRHATARATTRADEMVPFTRREAAPAEVEQAPEREPISETCEACRWEEVCLGDKICWDAVREDRLSGRLKRRRLAERAGGKAIATRDRWTREAGFEPRKRRWKAKKIS
jgi:hypothetical protein